MLQIWNNNMGKNVLPSWINCIDESMSKWINEYMCPGFMYIPRKPWKFGNEYHDAGCADSDIICALDLREGKEQPQNLGPKEFDNIGKTTGILLQLTKPVWSTGKVFVLDSGFCVVQALVELKKKGLFAAQQNHAHFDNKNVGDVNAIKGTMDGVPFHIHAMKEPDYIMMLMSTNRMTLRMGVMKRRHYTVEGVKKVGEFQYPEIVHNHYKFHDMIGNHNSFQMHLISMEETWMTMRWANRVFCFLLTITIVNIQNAAVYFLNKPKLDAMQSQRQIASN